jgi:hypothetical protein
MSESHFNRKILLLCILCSCIAIAEAFQEKHREFSRSKEKELRIFLNISFARITIEEGEQALAAVVDYDVDETEKQKLYISYDISNEIGTLRIKLKESSRFWGNDEDKDGGHRHVDLKLSNALPISLEAELGAGTGEIDLTNLQIKDLKLSTGASSVTMKCSNPNPIFAEDITIETGVSKFTGMDLGNLNFRNMKFSGGVGSYKLGFNGKFHQSAEVQIDIGLGSLTMNVPKTVPTKLVYNDNWLSSFNLDDDFEKKRNGVYETEDFQDAFKRLTIRLQSGLGSVRIYRK